MRTNFTQAQLAQPEIAEADRILQTCVHYGFCTNTCPTYVLTRDENDSPRGRIDLIRAMLEKGGPPEPKTVHHLDRCLSCLSCMTTCAVKVDYVHLIDRGRAYIEQHFRRPPMQRAIRALLAALLPRPRLFGLALRLGTLAKPFAGLLPASLRNMLTVLPTDLRSEILAPQVYAAEGSVKKRVTLLAGCAQQALDGAINAATIRLLQRHGCEVVIAQGAGCCGSLNLHMGHEATAMRQAGANVAAWTREIDTAGLDAVIVNASGCGTTVKDYGHLLARDPLSKEAARIGALTRDVTELMQVIGLVPTEGVGAYRVAYHDPCSMQHGQKVIREPRALLAAAGFRVVDVPEKHFCCGSAGTYNLLQPEMADALGQRKATHIASTEPDIIATGNIGCMTQLRRYSAVPIVHTAELLDWATGGPMPPALRGIELRPPEPIAKPTPEAPTAPSADAGFW